MRGGGNKAIDRPIKNRKSHYGRFDWRLTQRGEGREGEREEDGRKRGTASRMRELEE